MTGDDDSTGRGRGFIARLGKSAPMVALAEDAEGFAEAVEGAPGELGEALDRVEWGAERLAFLRSSAFASGACDRSGRIVAADATFTAMSIADSSLRTALRSGEPQPDARPRMATVMDEQGDRLLAIVIAPAAASQAWPLDAAVRQALSRGRAAFAVLAVRLPGAAWTEVAQSFGLTGLQIRVTAALHQSGDLRHAARIAGVSYETAREAINGAMAKTGARRQPELIQQMTSLASGDLAAAGADWRALADVFDLTARQSQLAWMVGRGATRPEAARTLGISDHAAKTDLSVVFAACGVADAADLGRLVGEVQALAALAGATDIQWSTPASGARRAGPPLRLVRRQRERGRIAIEDHGPQGGTPVVVMHTPTNGRHLPRVLVAAMHRRNLRPISVERPGYGLTTPCLGPSHPLEAAAADLIEALDAMGLVRVRILGRGCAAALAFAALHPERVESGVLLGPAVPNLTVRRRDGILGAVVSLALEQPQMVRGFANMLARGSNASNVRQVTRAIARHSPADLTALDDPEIFADHLRSCQQAALGDGGFMAELPLFAAGWTSRYDQDGRRWSVMVGGRDPLHRAGSWENAWQAHLPGARVVMIPEAGRFLHFSHPDAVAAALAREVDG